MIRIKDNKKLFKRISIILCLMVVIGFVNSSSIGVQAEPFTKPTFKVKINSVTPNPATIGEDITVTGTINPQPFETTITQKKQIVLVLGVSGTASGNKREDLKDAAKKFIDNMSKVTNMEIAIVSFDKGATIITRGDNNEIGFVELSEANITKLKASIDSSPYDRGTNTGEGLRKAEYMLQNGDPTANKSIVFVSNGVPDGYSVNKDIDNNDYYTTIDNNNNPPYYFGSNGNGDPDNYSEEYAKIMGNIIKEKSPNVFSIAYDLSVGDGKGNRTIEEIHSSMGGSDGTFFIAKKGNDLGSIDEAFNEIADEILASYPVTNVNLNLNLPDGLELKGGGNTIPFKDIIYTKESETDSKVTYTAAPVDFSFVIKATKSGNYTLFENSTITFLWNGETITNTITDRVEIVISDLETKVTMKVSDSSGTINKEYDSTVNELNHVVDNNGEVYKLYGQSNVAINVEESDATDLRYRFVKDGQVPNETDWEYMELNGDVDTGKEGYLTQMPYDVSHMPLLTNQTIWSNRQEVFKTPFTDKTSPISTSISPANERYVTREDVTDKDGNIITRWVPKTLFVQNHYVAGYARDYKEASKTWGYIKVKTTGDYWFRTWSDDGFYGTITVNDELKVLGDDFKPRGSSKIDAAKSIRLEAGEYYPIYLEYFNWGGSADFRIECSLNDKNNYQQIGPIGNDYALYPSKSDSPIGNGNNVFMGNKTVNFKTEPGIYTIEYELLKDKNYGTALEKDYDSENRGKGSFGKFKTEERFELSKTLSKVIIEKGEEFEIKYTLEPKPIKLTDLYKGSVPTNKPNSILVKYISLKDELPEGLLTVDEGKSSIEKSIETIQYTLEGNQYVANEYIFSVMVKSELTAGNSNFSQSGEIGYRDVSLKDDSRISQKQRFLGVPTLNFENSLITKHGLFVENTINGTNEINATNTMNYTLGFIIDAKGSNNNFTLNVEPNDVEINNIYIYKLDDQGKIITNTKVNISNENIGTTNNGIGNLMEIGEKYAVVYSVNAAKEDGTTMTVTAQLDSGDTKILELNLDENLPDLF